MKAVQHHGGSHGPSLGIGASHAINALGFDAQQSWAYRRAELTGYAASPFRLGSGERATMALVGSLPPRSFGAARMQALLQHALSPLLTRTATAFGGDARLGLSLGLPLRMNGRHPLKRHGAERRQLEAFSMQCVERHGLRCELDVQARGHAAAAASLLWACQRLAAGELDVALVGGVDSYYDPDVMQALMLDRRVLSSEDHDAFVPGEGAAFLLLARGDGLRRLGSTDHCHLETVSMGEEPAHMGQELPCQGSGLSQTLMPLSDRLRNEGRELDWILGDVSNEDYRSAELQLAYPRFSFGIVKREIPMEFLPMSMGDLGAASLPTCLSLAHEGLRRGDPRAHSCLAFSASVGEDRGGVLVSFSARGR